MPVLQLLLMSCGYAAGVTLSSALMYFPMRLSVLLLLLQLSPRSVCGVLLSDVLAIRKFFSKYLVRIHNRRSEAADNLEIGMYPHLLTQCSSKLHCIKRFSHAYNIKKSKNVIDFEYSFGKM